MKTKRCPVCKKDKELVEFLRRHAGWWWTTVCYDCCVKIEARKKANEQIATRSGRQEAWTNRTGWKKVADFLTGKTAPK